MPDWLCAGKGKLAVAEAKGSHQAGSSRGGGLPGPLKTAQKQIDGVVVEKITAAGTWIPRSVKGWAVMSRWGAEVPRRDAFQFVLDPDTRGEPLSVKERDEAIQDIARMHVGQTLQGMGYGDLAMEFADQGLHSEARTRETVMVEVDGEKPSDYLGVVVGPFGILPMSLEEARAISGTLPQAIASQLRFAGLDIEVVRQLRDDDHFEPRPSRADADGTRIGADGFLMAPLGRAIKTDATI